MVEESDVVEVTLSQREREMSLPQPPPRGRGEKRAPKGGTLNFLLPLEGED